MARNHAELLLRNVGAARARAAEYWGEKYLDDDRWYRLNRLGAVAEESYAALDDDLRVSVDAFVAGINKYLDEHPEAVSSEVAVVAPLTGIDIFANAGAMGLMFSPARAVAGQWLARQSQGQAGAAAVSPSALAPELLGSNAWAIGPEKSQSGNALLLANPHLPWSGRLTWMEAHLTAPGLDVYGAALVGLPTINIGFTQHVAWSHTVNTLDTEDFYELEVVDADERLEYRFDGGTRPFERELVELRVATDEGLRVEPLEVLRSAHGPIIARHADKALALRRVGDLVRAGEALRQYWDMARAEGVDAFEVALAQQAIPGQNIIYADRDGTVAYYYGAAAPRRERGDTRFWTGFLPGDDPTLVWDQLHGFDEIPKVVNPPSGWVQNANDPPWLSTWPPELDIADFPAYFGPRGLGFRAQRSIRLLRESGTMSLEEMIQLKHSSRSEMADRLLPDLIAAVAEHGGEQARRAAGVLSDWDRSTDADSEGALLFETWVNQAFRASNGSPFARVWSPEAPLETPSGLWNAPAAVAALEAAAATVESEHGRVDVAWGDVYRMRSGNLDLPANGGPDRMGIFRAAGFVPGSDGKRMLVGGDSFVAAVEMADPPRAFALIGYGNASQADSPHRTDQLALFATKQLRPVWFGAEEVEAHAITRTEFPR